MIQRGHGGDDLADLGGREDDGQLELGGGADQLDFGRPGTAEGFFPEQLEGADGLGGGGAGEVTFGLEVEKVVAQFFGGDLVGGLAVVLGEVADAGEVSLLGAGEHRQEPQVGGEAD
jgi:hypothetical protein